VTHEYPHDPTFDSVTISRVMSLGDFGFTQRQREFLVTVMVHAGCFLERQYCTFTGTARGQNSREFVARLVARGFARAIEPGRVRRGRLYAITGELKYLIPDPGDLSKMTDTGTSASGIAVDDLGNIYAADVGFNNLRKYARTVGVGASSGYR
jgi:hypothetical protein